MHAPVDRLPLATTGGTMRCPLARGLLCKCHFAFFSRPARKLEYKQESAAQAWYDVCGACLGLTKSVVYIAGCGTGSCSGKSLLGLVVVSFTAKSSLYKYCVHRPQNI